MLNPASWRLLNMAQHISVTLPMTHSPQWHILPLRYQWIITMLGKWVLVSFRLDVHYGPIHISCFKILKPEGPEGQSKSYPNVATGFHNPTMAVENEARRPDWKSFSCSSLLLLLFARPIELDLGPSTLALLYVTSGLATNLLCHWGMVSAPPGLAAMGSLWALVIMGMMITLKDTVRLKRPGDWVENGKQELVGATLGWLEDPFIWLLTWRSCFHIEFGWPLAWEAAKIRVRIWDEAMCSTFLGSFKVPKFNLSMLIGFVEGKNGQEAMFFLCKHEVFHFLTRFFVFLMLTFVCTGRFLSWESTAKINNLEITDLHILYPCILCFF